MTSAANGGAGVSRRTAPRLVGSSTIVGLCTRQRSTATSSWPGLTVDDSRRRSSAAGAPKAMTANEMFARHPSGESISQP